MTTAVVRPELWREGDFLYVNGRWYEMVDGQWTAVEGEDDADVLATLDLAQREYPDTTYITQNALGATTTWPRQPTAQEREAREPVAGEWAADPGSAPKPKDYENLQDPEAGRAMYEAAYAQWDTRKRLFDAFEKAEHERKLKADEKPDKTNYRPERYTDPQTGKTYERLQADGAWTDVTPAPKAVTPTPILSFDQMIYKAVERGDIARAVAIDAFRDSLGVDRLAVANNVMSFWLGNADAATIRGWMANPATMPPMLGQALDIYSRALSPTGGVDINAVMGQNAQLQPLLEQDIMAGMQANPSWRPKDPYTGEDLLQKMASQQFPTIGGTPSPADAQGNVTPRSTAEANQRTQTDPYYQGERYQEDQDSPYYEGPIDTSRPGQYNPAMQDRANASTGVYGQQWATQGTGRGGINPSVGPSRNVYGEDVESPYLRPADQPQTVFGQDIDSEYIRPADQPKPVYAVPEIDEATGEPRNALPPAMANAKARYDYFLKGDADKGIAPQEPYRAAQSSGYYAADLEEQGEAARAASGNYVYDPTYKQPSGSLGGYVSRASQEAKQRQQPAGDYASILGPYAEAAARDEERRRKPKRSPIYSA